MPRLSIVSPAKDEKTSSERLATLLKSAQILGVSLDPQGFATAWLSDAFRVFLALDDNSDKPEGLAIMAFGRRFYDSDMTASVAVLAGPARPALLHYMTDTCRVLGVTQLFFEGIEGDDPEISQPVNMRMIKVD